MSPKSIIVLTIELLLLGVIFLFCFKMFGEVEHNGKTGVFDVIGVTGVDKNFTDIDSDGGDRLDNIQNTNPPEIKGNGSILTVGEIVDIKDLILVKPVGSDSFVSGSTESGFKVNILSVKDTYGNILEEIPIDAGNASDEILAQAYYDSEDGKIQFNNSGVFTISVKVYGENGRYALKDISIPVEM